MFTTVVEVVTRLKAYCTSLALHDAALMVFTAGVVALAVVEVAETVPTPLKAETA
jgi:hypothetical protein